MAESQHPFTYLPPAETALKAAFTVPRLGKFLVKGGYSFPHTMEWYLWNARLIKSLQFPMHAAEVTLRNALVEHLTLQRAPREWAFDAGFLAWLASRSPITRDALNKSKDRLLRERMKPSDYRRLVKGVNHVDVPDFGYIATDDVVAKLSFEFWTGLLDKEFEADWHATLKNVFPNAPIGTSRRDIWMVAVRAKDLRNRMAHHEPIFHLPIEAEHNSLLNLIGMRCRETKDWVRHFSTFPDMLLQQPKSVPSQPYDDLGSSLRTTKVINDLDTMVSDILPDLAAKDSPGVLLFDGTAYRILVPNDILNWLSSSASVGLADLTETINQFLAKTSLANRVGLSGPDLNRSAAGAMFYARNVPTRKKPTALVLTDDGTAAGTLIGVVMKEDVLPARSSA